MKRKRRALLMMCLLVMIPILYGCSSPKSNDELKLGHYVSKEDLFSLVVLEEDNRFTMWFSAYSSYLGSGEYTITDGMLILHDEGRADKETQYRFKINNDSLIFEDGEYASKYFEQGEVFKLERTNK